MRLNFKAVQDDIRKIAIAVFLAALISVLVNDKSFSDFIWPIMFSVCTWLLGIIEAPGSENLKRRRRKNEPHNSFWHHFSCVRYSVLDCLLSGTQKAP